MDPIIAIAIAGVFTLFGYAWGRPSAAEHRDLITHSVTVTIQSLENDGYLLSEIRNGEVHYVKWDKSKHAADNT